MNHICKLFLIFSFVGLTACSQHAAQQSDVTVDPSSQAKVLGNFEKAWQVSAGSGFKDNFMQSEPVFYKGVIYTADQKGHITAVDAQEGKILWTIDTKQKIASGPAVNGNIIVVSTSDARVMAFRLEDGERLWATAVSNEVLAMPLISGNKVLVKTTDGNFFALNAKTGKYDWQYRHGAPSLVLRGGSKPAVSGNTVVVGFDDGKVVGLSLDRGKVFWETVVIRPTGSSPLERMVDIDADPIIDDGVVYVANYQGNLTAISLSTGNKLWSYKLSSHSGLEISLDQLFVSDTDGIVWAFDKDTGSVMWKQDALGVAGLSSPVVMNNYVVVVDQSGELYWLSMSDGSVLARKHAISSPVMGAPKVFNKTLYLLTQKGNLSAFKI